ncbi:MAG TPA: glutamate-1-semialdehyde 2,1-aminomutase [Firmicutes bacterium]|nr:glutamate-1-semialdehyde 2,1-aminomutase [Bacillota bacterium]
MSGEWRIPASERLFAEAKEAIPGGVNSPVRAFRAVGGQPVFVDRAAGAHLWDADGHRYVDFVGSWGPMILGHAHPEVVARIREAAGRGTSFGAPTELEVRLAQLIKEALPSIDLVRMVNSGTEATMSALRLARAYTGRTKVIKFEGCYHGHADSFLIKAGSGALTMGVPDSPGVPPALAQETVILPYNDLAAVEEALQRFGSEVAAVIVEPVAGNMGCVPPAPGFLEGLRRVTQEHGVVLIFDEVITGFRASYGGAQGRYGIVPDLTCLGKIIGGGLPVGAYGGRREIMSLVSPAGPVYQAGTLSGNPLAMAAGIATLELLRELNPYAELEDRAARLGQGLVEAALAAGVPVQLNRVGSVFTLFFTDRPVTDFASAFTADTQAFAAFFQGMLRRGVYLPPSQFESAFLSAAHTDADLEFTLAAAREALAEVAEALRSRRTTGRA